MTTYQTALFVHLVALLLATGAAAVTHVAHGALRRSRTLADAARWNLMTRSAARAFPLAALALFASGAYMVSDAWSWRAPWVVASLAGLAAVVLVGDLHGRNGRALGAAIGRALEDGGDGPVPLEITRLLESRIAIAASYAPTLVTVGVVYVMVAKPGASACFMALAVPAVVAAATGALLADPPRGVFALIGEQRHHDPR